MASGAQLSVGLPTTQGRILAQEVSFHERNQTLHAGHGAQEEERPGHQGR